MWDTLPDPLLYLVCFGISIFCRVVSLLASITLPLLSLGQLLALLEMEDEVRCYTYWQALSHKSPRTRMVKPNPGRWHDKRTQHTTVCAFKRLTTTAKSLPLGIFNANFVKFQGFQCKFLEVTMQLNSITTYTIVLLVMIGQIYVSTLTATTTYLWSCLFRFRLWLGRSGLL